MVDAPPLALKFALVNGALELGDASRKVTAVETSGDPHVERLLVLVDSGTRTIMAADAYSDVMQEDRVAPATRQSRGHPAMFGRGGAMSRTRITRRTSSVSTP